MAGWTMIDHVCDADLALIAELYLAEERRPRNVITIADCLAEFGGWQ